MGRTFRKIDANKAAIYLKKSCVINPSIYNIYLELYFCCVDDSELTNKYLFSKYQLYSMTKVGNLRLDYTAVVTFSNAAVETGNHIEAIRELERVEKRYPNRDDVANQFGINKVRHLIFLKRYAEAREILQFLAPENSPRFHAESYAMKTLVEYGAGNWETYHHLANKNLIWKTDVEPGTSVNSLENFNNRLISHIKAHPTLVPLAGGSIGDVFITSTNGKDSLVYEDYGIISDLKSLIMKKISEYILRYPDIDDHFFLRFKNQPKKISRLWGVVGRRYDNSIAHYHKDTYMTAVYYAKIPDRFSEADETKAGWLEIFRPDLAVEFDDKDTDHILPKTGSMIIFPSHIYHRAMPCPPGDERVILACDIVLAK